MTTLTFDINQKDYRVICGDRWRDTFLTDLVEMRWNNILVPIVEFIMVLLSPLLYQVFIYRPRTLTLPSSVPLVTGLLLSVDAIFIQCGYYFSRGATDFIRFIFTGEFNS